MKPGQWVGAYFGAQAFQLTIELGVSAIMNDKYIRHLRLGQGRSHCEAAYDGLDGLEVASRYGSTVTDPFMFTSKWGSQ